MDSEEMAFLMDAVVKEELKKFIAWWNKHSPEKSIPEGTLKIYNKRRKSL